MAEHNQGKGLPQPPAPTPEPLIPKHGGYRRLKSFQIAQLVYDLTVRFCDRYVDKKSRTHDQMVQAARSGVQNIAEESAEKVTQIGSTTTAPCSDEWWAPRKPPTSTASSKVNPAHCSAAKSPNMAAQVNCGCSSKLREKEDEND